MHVYWRLSEPAEGEDLKLVCRLRRLLAEKIGGDLHFASAHQPIRVAGSIYGKHGQRRLVRIQRLREAEHHLGDLAEAIELLRPLPGCSTDADGAPCKDTLKRSVDEILTTPARENDVDAWTRFHGASVALGHFVRQAHEGRLTREAAWEQACGYNAAMLRPPWPVERLQKEYDRLWRKHLERNGSPRAPRDPPHELPVFTLGAVLDDTSPMPQDLIAPRLLTPGGVLVLGGAPKVGKSSLLIHLLVRAAGGEAFLDFVPARPLRVFYLQAEIHYHYLRERLRQLSLDASTLQSARNNLVVTPRVRMILDEDGLSLSIRAVYSAFPNEPPDVICLDPIRNLFDGGREGEGENDNTAMLFFLRERVERLREGS